MALEIEAKLKVDSLEPVRQKLLELGAKPGKDVLQQDYYFDNSAGTLENSDSALRLRYQEQAGRSKIVLI
jgi:adenylate cyclase class IV